ncbi:MAG: hypothetical protein M2R45_02313 [Verrucomicrobia subdivision 3 bacterium]|nr:hypothetical protein [Limisphaerales bacterium]MCS1414692.1 hypothetical protein [Limisphaerales bacterium]
MDNTAIKSSSQPDLKEFKKLSDFEPNLWKATEFCQRMKQNLLEKYWRGC